MRKRKWAIYTENGEIQTVKAPSLRTALRDFDETKSPVVAVVEASCLPCPADDRAFVAVFLRNPRFTPPPDA